MKLSLSAIRSITVGAVNVVEKEDGIHFFRFTQKQIDAFEALRPHLYTFSQCTAGVRLDFHTDSKTFKFTVSRGKQYEILINDVFMYAYDLYNNDFTNNNTYSFSINLPEGTNRVTLVLPSHADPGVITELEIDDGATISRHIFDKKILFLGDSITQGAQSGVDSLSFAYRVSRFFNAESIIQGVGGAFFHETIFDEALPFEPDIVISAYGTNDWGTHKSKEELAHHANAFLGAVKNRYGDRKLIGISPVWRADAEGVVKPLGTFEESCSAVKELILLNGFSLVEGNTLTPPRPEYYPDKVHPSGMCFSIYSENLIKQMLNII